MQVAAVSSVTGVGTEAVILFNTTGKYEIRVLLLNEQGNPLFHFKIYVHIHYSITLLLSENCFCGTAEENKYTLKYKVIRIR